MSAENKEGPPQEPNGPREERLSLEEFRRLVEEAQKRGEDPGPIIRRLVLQVIEEVREGLESQGRWS